MATTCDACGHRDNEVKSGTGIADEGTRIELRLTDTSDLTRDILKVGATKPDLNGHFFIRVSHNALLTLAYDVCGKDLYT